MTVHVLDTHHLGRQHIIAATALETDDGLAFFDVGPESTFDITVARLRQLGLEAADVRHVFLSHIHFDHAGAAWRFAETGATIYVHPRGAPHLSDPSRLVKSAKRIFGDQMEALWGRFAPIPSNRLKILEDGDVVRLSPFTIHAIATPGHASHHHIYHCNEIVFGGDIAGVRIKPGPPIPPFVPPELHIESWHESIDKIRALNAKELYLPHFGQIHGRVSDHLDALDQRVGRWSQWLRDRIRSGMNEEQLRSAFAEYEHEDLRQSNRSGDAASLISDYEAADPSYMAVSAALRYWQKYHPDEITDRNPGQ